MESKCKVGPGCMLGRGGSRPSLKVEDENMICITVMSMHLGQENVLASDVLYSLNAVCYLCHLQLLL